MVYKTFIRVKGKLVVRVTFSLPGSTWAGRVQLVGDFNDWNPTSHPFSRDHDGRWTATVDLQPDRTYEFRYLCDGREWMNDSQADGDVPNPYGSSNSVVVTRAKSETSRE
jgi:1,4-alpha-glucan branching enzyme